MPAAYGPFLPPLSIRPRPRPHDLLPATGADGVPRQRAAALGSDGSIALALGLDSLPTDLAQERESLLSHGAAIPVIDAEKPNLYGIVTATELLKALPPALNALNCSSYEVAGSRWTTRDTPFQASRVVERVYVICPVAVSTVG